ncbi:helix-turn-helix domain-containing protein [Actinoallomurus purpureus]|uniref:helix-turn-helix domain-containing protein n=1 Tax=Actinoallomurus purpureus TaxID=478114 RepID=UPI002092BAB0|nr:helix-turn-helix transcriptional regulator [Actinoallomurus purpureus]MCO6007237.1 helix-turn-helix domain-containing protein [Actinoallomurus purpureus]
MNPLELILKRRVHPRAFVPETLFSLTARYACPTISGNSEGGPMAERISPTLRRRRLAARLRQLREQAGLKVEEVARVVEWTPSKVVWIEGNRGKRPNPRDVRDLCDAYGVGDEREREYLVQLARDGRQRGWWDPYDAMLSERYATYIGLEAEAAEVLNFEPLMIPGLLQTADYARALFRGPFSEIGKEEAEARVEVRLKRQEALHQKPPLRLVAILDEAALHRQVGGPDVMRAQLEHLLEATKLPRVTIQVIPYGAGAHPSMTGGFAVLKFPEPDDPTAVYVDTPAGQLFIEEPGEIDRFQVAFQHLLGSAASPGDTITLLADMARA